MPYIATPETPGPWGSENMAWVTPQAFFDQLDLEFHFTLDAAASEDNSKCEEFWCEEDDALKQRWVGIVWLNPPYGRSLGKWIDKAIAEAARGSTVVVLVPSRTDTKWFRRAWDVASEVRFVPGRLKFEDGRGHGDPAPFPSVVFVLKDALARGIAGPRVVSFIDLEK